MNAEIKETIQEHRYEIDTLKDSLGKVLNSLDELTKAMNAQATQFAVFASKHDTVSVELTEVKKEIKVQAEYIASTRPFVESLRGLVWKIVASSVMGGTGVGVIIVAIIKNT